MRKVIQATKINEIKSLWDLKKGSLVEFTSDFEYPLRVSEFDEYNINADVREIARKGWIKKDIMTIPKGTVGIYAGTIDSGFVLKFGTLRFEFMVGDEKYIELSDPIKTVQTRKDEVKKSMRGEW